MGSPPNKAPGKIRQLAMLFHIQKTTRLVGALLHDERVAGWRKFSFIGVIALLLLAMLVPEFTADIATGLIPVLNIFGLPVEIVTEAGVDWAVLGVAAFQLLKLFPADIVGEHYDRLFRGK